MICVAWSARDVLGREVGGSSSEEIRASVSDDTSRKGCGALGTLYRGAVVFFVVLATSRWKGNRS